MTPGKNNWTLLLIVIAIVLILGRLIFSVPAGQVMEVTVNYTGEGEVNATNLIHIFVFDTPQIGPGSIPISHTTLDKNGAASKIEGLTASPVYLAVTYDSTGTYDGVSGPPPPGVPVSVYQLDATGPAAIELKDGETAKVKFVFDDSVRMP